MHQGSKKVRSSSWVESIVPKVPRLAGSPLEGWIERVYFGRWRYPPSFILPCTFSGEWKAALFEGIHRLSEVGEMASPSLALRGRSGIPLSMISVMLAAVVKLVRLFLCSNFPVLASSAERNDPFWNGDFFLTLSPNKKGGISPPFFSLITCLGNGGQCQINLIKILL